MTRPVISDAIADAIVDAIASPFGEAGGAPGPSAPALSALSATKTGETTADLGATTDTANGRMDWIVTVNLGTPTLGQMQAGNDSTGATAAFSDLNNTITTTGAKTSSATGLTASTIYYAYVSHQNATGQATVAYAGTFTTDAAIVADYTVSNTSEWNTVMALGSATLSGKVVEIISPISGQLDIPGTLSPTNWLTIRSATSADTLEYVNYNAGCGKIRMDGVYFQATGWPRNQTSLINWKSGSYGDIDFLNCNFRHGVGATLADYDGSELAEFTRYDHVQTATTTSTAYALTWQTTAVTSFGPAIYFFNRGSETVYVEIGGSGVVATAGSTAVAAGGSTVISGLDPNTDTHMAVLAAANTSEINGRTEIGLLVHQAQTFWEEGAALITGDFRIIGCKFEDLGHAINHIPSASGDNIFALNEFRRIYADIMGAGVSTATTGNIYFHGNWGEVGYAQSNVGDQTTGDAGDPHSDVFQLFGDATAPIPYAETANNAFGKSIRTAAVNDSAQFSFIEDNQKSPYLVTKAFSFGDLCTATAPNGISWGEAANMVAEFGFVWGTTTAPKPWTGSSSIGAMTDSGSQMGVVDSMANTIQAVTGSNQYGQNNHEFDNASPVTDIFPSHGTITGGMTAAQLRTAMTPVSAHQDKGPTATHIRALFDETMTASTYDPLTYVDRTALHPGTVWDDLTAQTVSTLITLGNRTVICGGNNQTVTPGTGTEVSINDGAWTSGATTVSEGDTINMRRTTSANPATNTPIAATINGVSVSTDCTTAAGLTNAFYLNSALFRDPSGGIAADSRIISIEMKGEIPTPGSGTKYIFRQDSNGGVYFDSANNIRGIAYDSGGLVTGDFSGGAGTFGTPVTMRWTYYAATGNTVVTVDGTEVVNVTDTPNTSAVDTGQELCFASSVGWLYNDGLPALTKIEYIKFWSHQGAGSLDDVTDLDKEISVSALGSIANINSDTWRLGSSGSVTAV